VHLTHHDDWSGHWETLLPPSLIFDHHGIQILLQPFEFDSLSLLLLLVATTIVVVVALSSLVVDHICEGTVAYW
jgi:hypothetical protein